MAFSHDGVYHHYNNTYMLLKSLLISSLIPALVAEEIKTSNMIELKEGESKESIIKKAAHVVPTANQWEALRNEFIGFVHFGPNTFTRREWGDGFENPAVFDLKKIDTDQWVRAMKAAGMKKVIITVKHHDGFVLWQSRYTKQGVMSSPFKNGRGDILKDLSKSCQKYGMKLGIYLSPADLYQIENAKGLYGNLSKTTKRTIPRDVPNRPFKNKKKFQFEVDDYNEYFLNQLFELLTEYGPVHELWFDGAHPKRKGNQQYNYKAWEELIRTLAPEAVIFGRADIRWCGNEAGATRSTEWNVIPFNYEINQNKPFADMTGQMLGSREQLYGAKFLLYQQAEVNTSIREGWFYRDDVHQKIRSVDDVFDIYERSVGGNATFLLNVTPNRDGRLSDAEVKVLEETGEIIRKTYDTDLFAGATGAKEVLDGNHDTYLVMKDNSIVITTPKSITLNRLVLQEAIRTHSERVEKFAVDAMIGGQWKQISESSNIGYKRILRFDPVTTDKIRVRVLESRLQPAFSNITAHYYQSRPPRLVFQTNRDGQVTITPFKPEFGWKPHGQQSTANLNTGMSIHFTTDGSTPTADSPTYTEAVNSGNVVLKAVAISNGASGSVTSEQIGIPKKDWKLIGQSSHDAKHPASNMMDANNRSYWMTQPGEKHFIAIDLGKKQKLRGFAYTPQTEHAKGMMAKGRVLASSDGKNWKRVDSFDFGNLINDPSKRYHYFKKSIEAAFIKIEVTEIARDGKQVAVAEIDLF